MATEYKCGPIGAGTVSGSTGTDDVVGVSSSFTTQFIAGDTIVIIDSGGNHDAYTVKTVTDATNIILTTNLSETYTTCQYYGLRTANLFTTPNYYPRSTYDFGDPVRTGSGALLYRGYTSSRWKYAHMSVAEFTAMRTYLIGVANYSGACYVRTRNADDTWSTWYGIVDFPSPRELTRWNGYSPITLLFHLVTAL